MNPSTLLRCIKEAERFIKLAKLAYSTEFDKDKKYCNGGKNCAAAKRASMDLSRLLSDLRLGR